VPTPAPVAIGIDIGGTQLRAAAVGDGGEVVARRRRGTAAQDEGSLLGALREVVGELGPELPVGIGIAGLVTPDGIVRYGPNIGVRDLALAERVRETTGVTVAVANDGSTAALAEQRVGAGRGHQDVLLATVGTGIGGGVVLGGQVLLGANGYAGELGHLIVRAGGRRCPCGNLGCIEAYASGSAIGAIARDRLQESSRPSVLRELDQVDGPAVTRAAAERDELAVEVLEECGRWLGIALASSVNVLDPELILVGGGAAEATAPWLLPAARASLRDHLVGSPWREPPPIELAELGDDAGVVGAALLVLDRDQRRVSATGRPAVLGSGGGADTAREEP
jgi:glucokinase